MSLQYFIFYLQKVFVVVKFTYPEESLWFKITLTVKKQTNSINNNNNDAVVSCQRHFTFQVTKFIFCLLISRFL